MKIVENKSDLVSVSSEGTPIEKGLSRIMVLVSVFYGLLGGDLLGYAIGVSCATFFILLSELYTQSIFDSNSDSVTRHLKIFNRIIHTIEAPLSTSKLVANVNDAKGFSIPYLYIKTESGKQYMLGSFYSRTKLDLFLRKAGLKGTEGLKFNPSVPFNML